MNYFRCISALYIFASYRKTDLFIRNNFSNPWERCRSLSLIRETKFSIILKAAHFIEKRKIKHNSFYPLKCEKRYTFDNKSDRSNART